MSIEKEDIVNALKVLATMLKAAKLSTGDIAELMIKELEFVDFIPVVKIEENLQHNLKFNKSFEALYNISMAMANQCIVNKSDEDRFSKLDEEYQELIEASSNWKQEQDIKNISKLYDQLTSELSDVMFVLLHIAHSRFKITAFELLHMASSKMLARMNDDNYTAKN